MLLRPSRHQRVLNLKSWARLVPDLGFVVAEGDGSVDRSNASSDVASLRAPASWVTEGVALWIEIPVAMPSATKMTAAAASFIGDTYAAPSG